MTWRNALGGCERHLLSYRATRQTIVRIKTDPVAAEQILARWEAAEEARKQA